MAQERRPLRYIPSSQRQQDPQQQQQSTETSLPRKVIAGGIRVGSALASAPFSMVLGKGTLPAFGIGAGGDLLAQAVEEKTYPWEQLDAPSLSRAGIEGSIAAVPFGALVKHGKALVSAMRSGALTGAGEAGREYVSGQELDPASIGIATGLGAATGGLISKWISKGPASQPPAPTGPPKPVTLDDWLRRETYRPEEIETAATRAEALQVADPTHPKAGGDLARGLRVAATKTNRAGEETLKKVVNAGKADITQEAKNLTAAEKAIIQQQRAADEVVEGVSKTAQQAAKAETTAAAMLKKEADEAAAATKIEELKGGLEPQAPTARESYSAPGPDGSKQSASISYRAPKAEEGGAPSSTEPTFREPRTTNLSPEERKGIRKMSPARAAAVIGHDPEEGVAMGKLFKDGEGYYYNPKFKPSFALPAKEVPVAPPKPPVAPPPQGKTAAELLAEREGAAASGAGKADVPGPKEAGLADTTTGTKKLEELEQQLGREIPTPTGGKGAIPVEEAPKAGPPAEAPLVEGVKLSPPLAFKVAETVGEVPAGHTIARFFPPNAAGLKAEGASVSDLAAAGKNAALKAGAYNEELPDETIGLLTSLLGRADVLPPQPRGARKVQSPLWEMIGKISNELNLPKFPRGAQVKPNFKHVPEGVRPAAPAAPIAAAPEPPKTPAAVAPKAPTMKASAKPPVAAKPPAPPTPEVTIPKEPDPNFQPPMTREGLPGIDIIPDPPAVPPNPNPLPRAPVVPVVDAKPIPADLQIRLQALENKRNIAMNSGAATPDDIAKLSAEADALQLEIMKAQYPGSAKALTEASKRAKKGPAGPAEPPPAAQTPPEALPKPRLVKGKKGSGDETGAIGMEALLSGAGALGGAVVGGAMDPLDDPFASAVMGAVGGAGLGFAGPKLLEALSSSGITPNTTPELTPALTSPQGLMEVGRKFGHLIPHIQRFNYLMSGHGLAANAVVGPYSSGFWGALTKALSGDSRGWNALRMLGPGNVAKEMWSARSEALDLITRAEAGDPLLRSELGGEAIQSLPFAAREVIQLPARAMTTGDLGIRNILKKAGFSEDEAREMTLTSEPFLPSLVKLVNLRRGEHSPLLESFLPFVRTPANILEQGATRLPGVGFAVQGIREAHGAAPMEMQEQVIGQTIGTAIGIGGYLLGLGMPPEQAQFLRRYLSNAAGQYSLQMTLGFAAGQSAARGQGMVSPQSITELGRTFPLPAADPILDVASWASGNSSTLPRNLVPSLVRENLTDQRAPRPRYRIRRTNP